MSITSPFQPRKGANQKVTASTTSAVITIGAGSKSVRAMNAGGQVVYFRTFRAADGVEVATSADTPVATSGAAGSVLIIEKPQDHDSIAYVADSATPTINFQPGEGGC